MPWPTHEVRNQPPLLAGVNLYQTDAALVAGVDRFGAGWHAEALARRGQWAGSEEAQRLAARANRHGPVLQTHDAQGYRIDRVEFDPAWHALLHGLRADGLQARAWTSARAGAHVARAASFYLHAQVEAGSLCPVTMTFASLPLLQAEPLYGMLAPRLEAEVHDPRDLPLSDKSAILIGMGLTEKQGGSDLRGTQTTAAPLSAGGRGQDYRLTGHKWFFSAPMCDAHLVLARAPEGLSAFFVPRWQPDGSRNPVLIQRLKDKLGNRSNASAEVEFSDALGTLVGEPGRGIATLVGMANITRLDCAIASAALMRQALVQAVHHCRHRQAFGLPLAGQPLMQQVLADLALESEAALWLVLRLAQAFDANEQALLRLLTPAAKFWICKRAIAATAECMEVLGGNGYVEDGPLARLYREAPVNSIWEGSGNVMSLDVLRAIQQAGESLPHLLEQLTAPVRDDSRMRVLFDMLRSDLALSPDAQQAAARRITQALVLLAQAGLMRTHAPMNVAEAFIASRCDPLHGRVAGCLSIGDCESLLARAWPA